MLLFAKYCVLSKLCEFEELTCCLKCYSTAKLSCDFSIMPLVKKRVPGIQFGFVLFYVFSAFHMSICNVMSQTFMTVVEVVCLGQQCCSLLLRTHEHREPLLMYRTSPIN